MILVIDNYDSFVHNLARYIRLFGVETVVVRNDQVDLDWIRHHEPEGIVISPGPKAPKDAGHCLTIVKTFAESIPMLGICLGHQVIIEAFGGKVVRSLPPVHGRSSEIQHGGHGIFSGLKNPLRVGRYHSLCGDAASLPDCLEITAWLDDETIMAVSHREHPIVGLQFHPESLLTEHGSEMLGNFLLLAGIPTGETKVNHVFEPSISGIQSTNLSGN